MVDNRHLVLRQGAGFVRTDDLRTAQCLYGGQPADNGIALGHIGHTDAEHDSDHGGKPLRDCGYSQRYRNHERVDDHVSIQPACPQDLDPEDDNADA